MAQVDTIARMIQPEIEHLGYDLVRVMMIGGSSDPTLQVMAERRDTRQLDIEDCERISRHLSHMLDLADPIEGSYRLEVSSPGIDRPLKSASDFERFAGEVVDITLKKPMGEAADGKVNAARKKFRGTLEKAAGGWQIVWSDEPQEKPGRKVSKKREPAPLQALGFSLDELKEARLASVVDFKGRKPRAQGE